MVGETRLKQFVQQISQILATVHGNASSRPPPNLESPLHLPAWAPGATQDSERTGTLQHRGEQWTGPDDALLTTHTSLKLARIKPWVRHAGVKKHPKDVAEAPSPPGITTLRVLQYPLRETP